MSERIDTFISSTSQDLKKYREQVSSVILKLGAYPIIMENFHATAKNALQLCYDNIQEAEIFIGIYAHRYGYAPSSNVSFKTITGGIYQGDGKISITHWEYLWAQERGIPMLLYVIDDKNQDGDPLPWPTIYVEAEPGKSYLEEFKKHILNHHVVNFFNSPTHLALLVATALSSTINSLKSDLNRSRELSITLSKPNLGEKRQDWGGEILEVGPVYGRENDLIDVKKLLFDKFKLILLLGMGGIGKTFLATQIARDASESFDYVIWRSIRNAPPLRDLLIECIHFLSQHQITKVLINDENCINELLKYMQESRCLLVFDNVESILDPDKAGEYRIGYENYGHLISRIAISEHQSCLILTSREKPKEISFIEGKHQNFIYTHSMRGLSIEEGKIMLQDKGLSGSTEAWEQLINRYSGNPLALKVVGSMIREIYDANIDEFMAEDELIFGNIDVVIGQQFNRLSTLEKAIMLWLAIKREPITYEILYNCLASITRKADLMVALEALRLRSLLEKTEAGFTLQNVIMEYVSSYIIDTIYSEIATGNMNILQSYPLMEAQTKQYVRESQARILINPISQRLIVSFGETILEEKLKTILSIQREVSKQSPSFAAGNILNVLLHLKINVSGYDFSHLCVWEAYLQGAVLQEIDFSNADLSKSVFTENFGGVLSVAFSPNGHYVAAGTANNEVRTWNVADGKQQSSYKGHMDWVNSVAYNHDGTLIASGSNDHSIRIWNSETGESIEIQEAHKYRVRSVTFSPNKGILASGGGDEIVRIWDASTGKCIQELKGHQGWIEVLSFSPSGEFLASGGADHTARLWDMKTGACIRIFDRHTHWVRALAFSSDSGTLATGSYDKTILVWDLNSKDALYKLEGHTGNVLSLSFSKSGNTLASSSSDYTIRLWNLQTRECFKTLELHNGAVRSIVFSPNGELLASGSEDKTLCLWNGTAGQSLRVFQGETNPIGAIALAYDGYTLASGSYDHLVRTWDIRTGDCLNVMEGHTEPIPSVAFSSDGTHLVSGSIDHTIKLWNVRTGNLLSTLYGHTDWIWSVDISPDGKLIASGSVDQTIRLWELHTGKIIEVYNVNSRVTSIVFSPNGRLLASGSADHLLRLWDIETGKYLHELKGHGDVIRSVAFHPDKPIIASGSVDRTIRIWDIHNQICIQTLQEHRDIVMSVAFSPDGKLLASGSGDQTIRIWDIETGNCLKVLSGHNSAVWVVVFSSDNTHVASSSQDETIRIWNLETGICAKIIRPKRPYEGMNITGVRGLTDAQILTLKALGAVTDLGQDE